MRTIDGDALKRKAQKVATEAWKMKLIAKVETTLNQFIDWINEAPTIEPERELGEWKGYNADESNWRRNDGTPIFLICSKCNGMVINNGSAHWNYCPKCGEKKVTEWMQIQY